MFSPEQVDDIMRVVRRVRREPTRSPKQTQRPPKTVQTGVYLAMTSTGGVPAMSTGNVPGTAQVSLYTLSTSGITDYGVDVTAFNVSRSAVAGSTLIQLKQELLSGKLLVDFEDCST